MFSQARTLARASIEIARQLRVTPGRLGLCSARPLSGLIFQDLPSLGQTHPECPVTGIACCRSKAAAFFSTPSEFFYNHVAPSADRPVVPFPGRGCL
jgi:hypothetical protein